MVILCHYVSKLAAAPITKFAFRKNLVVLFVCAGLCMQANAGDPRYPVSAIPAELASNADAVYRENISTFKIVARNRASHFVRQVITIYNGKAKFHASRGVFYDKFRKIKSISGAVYDASGTLIKKLKDREIEDRSAAGTNMLSDDRYKYIDLSQGVYPYTIEVEYEIDYKFLFYIPEFSLFDQEKVSCQKAVFNLQYPKELTPRIKLLNVKGQAKEEKTTDGLLSKIWTFENIPPLKPEPYGPTFADLIPTILSAPTDFEYDNYVGTMDTWEGYGKWIASLNKDRNILPQSTKEKVIYLARDAKTREEKVKILYEYMQNKTRYVSIQLGIGGYQPFEASVVDSKGYGDCKALSNYMVALLDAVSIPSHYALIMAGTNARALHEDFPSTQFNHAIVAVPNDKDTLWLECTSQTNPFGYQGFFTGDRKALLITKNGAKVVRTKSYKAEENTQIRTAEVTLEATGDGMAKITTTYSGLQYDAEGIGDILNEQVETQKQLIFDITRIPTMDLIKYDLKKATQKNPSAILKLELGLRRYATVSSKRMFLVPNLMNRMSFIPEKIEARKTEFIEDFPYIDIDSIQYKVPESMYPEFLPEPLKIKSQFGEYESSFKLEQGSVIYVRKIKILKGTFPAAAYQEYVDFYKKINRADNTKIIFLSKT
jgi:transglutaminase-like putative cysteine protease